MKKYLFGLFAIALALGLSSFGKNEKSIPVKTEQSLYWYYIVDDLIGDPVDGTNLRTRSQVFETVGCPGESGEDCARGYLTTQTFEEEADPVTGVDEHIMEDFE